MIRSAPSAATICAMFASAIATYLISSNILSPNSVLLDQESGQQKVHTVPSPRLIRSRSVNHKGKAREPLCKIGNEYTKGRWVYDDSIQNYPYLGGEDYEWGPRCTDMEKEYLATGVAPAFLKYKWKPETCVLAPFDKENLCRLMDGTTIGIIGDSMQQQFAHSLMGLMLGSIQDNGSFYVSPDHGKLMVELCPNSPYSVSLVFRRWNKYQGTDEDRSVLSEMARLSDYLVLNWGVHYQPWLEMENSTQDFVRVLEQEWRPPQKKPQRLFWRSTIAAHDNCAESTGPVDHVTLHKNPSYNTNEIMLQDEQIVRPLLKSNPVLNVTFLRIEKSTLMRTDGHRVVGHGGSEDCLHYCEPGPTDSWVELFYHHVVMGI